MRSKRKVVIKPQHGSKYRLDAAMMVVEAISACMNPLADTEINTGHTKPFA